ncbi:hypothetical protein R1flu_014361 [Riccia fluitans]|uniref:Uncharacterized protein n=1 Tax=Riccia fluitans TaxID=41844 RepID=A0ABD1YG74_9MARC
MELLAQQIATQVENSKAANASKGTSGQQSSMGTDEPMNKDSGHSQFGSQDPEQGQLPKVLFKASSSGGMKDKAPIIESPNNRKPPTYASKTHTQTQGKVVKAFIDTQQLSNRINFLKEKTFVLYTVDISPSHDAILQWDDAVLRHDLGITISRRKQQSAQNGDAGKKERVEQQKDSKKQTRGEEVSPVQKRTVEAKEAKSFSSWNPYEALGEEDPVEYEEDEEELALVRGSVGGPEEVFQNQQDSKTEMNLEPQPQQVLPLEHSLVRMESTVEKRKRVQENRCGLDVTVPNGVENPMPNESPKGLNPGQTQSNSSKRQGGKKLASKTGKGKALQSNGAS